MVSNQSYKSASQFKDSKCGHHQGSLIIILDAVTHDLVCRVSPSKETPCRVSPAEEIPSRVPTGKGMPCRACRASPSRGKQSQSQSPRETDWYSLDSTQECTTKVEKEAEGAPHDAKLVEEVLEVVRGLSCSSSGVLMDGPDSSSALAFTRSDPIPPGTYYFHRPAAKDPQPQQTPSWQARVAAVMVAFITLGLVMQSLIFMVALPYCGCHWKCLHNWFRVFISHIDGPFKVFTFIAAIQRAAGNPSIWLNGFEKLSGVITRLLKPEERSKRRMAAQTHRKKD